MNFSDHFKHSLKVIGAAILLLVGAFFYLKHRIHDVINPPHVALPTNDKELITYNETHHTITVTTAKGTTTAYSRNPTVELRKDGTVKIDKHAWGLECRPILGIGYQDTGRVYLGVNALYFHQFDAFSAIGFPASMIASSPTSEGHVFIEPITGVSWNFYSNTSLAVGVNTLNLILREKPELGIALTVRL